MDSQQQTAILSPIDQLMPRTYTRVFLVFHTSDTATAASQLSTSLATLCKTHLPYLTGRITTSADHGNRLAISYSSSDPLPEIVPVPCPSDFPSYDVLEQTNAPLHHFARSLSPLEVMTGDDAAAFGASIATLPCGRALILCICVHHALMDGAGVSELAELWAGIASGRIASVGAADPHEPLHRLERLRAATRAVAVVGPAEMSKAATFTELLYHHPQYRLLSAADPRFAPPEPPFPPSTSRIHLFSAAKLVQAREVLKGKVGTDKLTTNNILSALAWSVITRIRVARRARSGEEVDRGLEARLGFAVNGRSKLGDDFGPGKYFGNVNLYGLGRLSVSKLLKASEFASPGDDATRDAEAVAAFAAVVEEFASAAARVTRPFIGEVLSLVEQAPDTKDVGYGWQSFHSLDFTLTSWANQGFYGFDFGDVVGKPKFVRVPFVEFDGLMIVLPRRRDTAEKIDAVLFLAVDDQETLEKDAVWQSWR